MPEQSTTVLGMTKRSAAGYWVSVEGWPAMMTLLENDNRRLCFCSKACALHCVIVLRHAGAEHHAIVIPLYAHTWLRDVHALRRELRGVRVIHVYDRDLRIQWDWRPTQRARSQTSRPRPATPATTRPQGGPRSAA